MSTEKAKVTQQYNSVLVVSDTDREPEKKVNKNTIVIQTQKELLIAYWEDNGNTICRSRYLLDVDDIIKMLPPPESTSINADLLQKIKSRYSFIQKIYFRNVGNMNQYEVDLVDIGVQAFDIAAPVPRQSFTEEHLTHIYNQVIGYLQERGFEDIRGNFFLVDGEIKKCEEGDNKQFAVPLFLAIERRDEHTGGQSGAYLAAYVEYWCWRLSLVWQSQLAKLNTSCQIKDAEELLNQKTIDQLKTENLRLQQALSQNNTLFQWALDHTALVQHYFSLLVLYENQLYISCGRKVLKANQEKAKRPRTGGRSEHVDMIKKAMRPSKQEEIPFKVFLTNAENGSIDDLTMTKKREKYEVFHYDYDGQPLSVTEETIRGWYSACCKKKPHK